MLSFLNTLDLPEKSMFQFNVKTYELRGDPEALFTKLIKHILCNWDAI